MSNVMHKDIRTLAYVLRRTNYGEADRILNLITPENGKISAIAKSVRREKSKLAGGIEMFSLVELNVHFGKGEMGTITSAKMLKYYDKLLMDLGKMELAALILKKISLASDSSDNSEFFEIINQCFDHLNKGTSNNLVEAWFWLNYAKAVGEQVNVYRDIDGDMLKADNEYEWNREESALMVRKGGSVNADVIKLMRLMLTSGLDVVSRVKNCDDLLPPVLIIARAVNKL